MTEIATPVSAGWYNDPLHHRWQRYWDGSDWTKQIRSAKKHPSSPWPSGIPRPPMPAAIVAHNRQMGIIAAVVVGVVVLAIVVIAIANKGSSSGGGSSGPQGADFVAKVQQDAQAAASDTDDLLTEIKAAQTDGDLVQIASDSSALHDNLTDFRDIALGAPGSYKDKQGAFVDAENELKNAIGSIYTWTGNPNAQTTAQWADQLANAVADWNAATTALWRAAQAGPPPLISANI